jgi:hypothetical protein
MSNRLEEFLVDLASDAALRSRVEANPEREFAKARLTGAERAALRSADSEEVRAALGRPHSDHLTQFGISGEVRKLLKKAMEIDARLKKAEGGVKRGGNLKRPKRGARRASRRKT